MALSIFAGRRRRQREAASLIGDVLTWATQKLACDGVLDMFAENALDGIDGGTSGGVYYAGIVVSGIPDMTDHRRMMSGYYNGSARWVFQQAANTWFGTVYTTTGSASTTAFLTGLASYTERVCAVLKLDRDNETHQISATNEDSGDVAGTEPSSATVHADGANDVYMLSLSGIGATILDGGFAHGCFILAVEPTAAQREALALGTPPWEVVAPGDVHRAWDIGAAYEGDAAGVPTVGGGFYWVPDVAGANGGPNAAVNARIRNGDLDDIVGV